MKGLEVFHPLGGDLIEDELCLASKMVGEMDRYLIVEKYTFDNSDDAEKLQENMKSVILEEEQSALESNCLAIAHLARKNNSLFVCAEASSYSLKDFLREKSGLKIKLKAALAYEITDIVCRMHENRIHHNNISAERFSINSHGILKLMPNYSADSNCEKFIQPSTRKTVPEEIINQYPKDPYSIDRFLTASLIDEIFMEEKPFKTSDYKYEKDKKVPGKVYKRLRNILDRDSYETYVKPRIFTGKTRKPDTYYLMQSLFPYHKYTGKLQAMFREKFEETH